ncbi:hypothetical protein BpHYR1_054511 [Brachionus plicatilis]|uniref:Uncharacterized protein n=1 Tax=Brachionus plicatilis TaxID=10195 RepID=A0A3M7S2C1_BRAPC|nr:hypothetical protein BpHYR1_054511 [Brachionus plicatilis]
MPICGGRRTRRALARLPYTLNFVLIALGIFTMLAMSIVIIIFEEFTAFTDYTQQWIEFNFFIHYWDKLTIARVYLSFLLIYGAVITGIGATQIYAMRKVNLSLLHLAPLLLIFVAVVTVLGAIAWLIVTAVNYNEGFLATGGFIFERMRFKGNVWKDLIYREQSFRLVTENQVPVKAPIVKIWVHQRERDFSCCGWDSYMDYARGNYSDLPESCCQRRKRVFGCANQFLTVDRSEVINTRGCKDVMYSWYRAGFIENIIMSIVGLGIAAFQFYLYTLNRHEYYRVLDELDDMRKPMMNTTMSMSTINSKMSGGGHGSGHMINFGPRPSIKYSQKSAPSINENIYNSSTGSGGATSGGYLPQLNMGNFSNPLQSIQNMDGRFSFKKPPNSTQSNRFLIEEAQN